MPPQVPEGLPSWGLRLPDQRGKALTVRGRRNVLNVKLVPNEGFDVVKE
jgi:hypothetical protein